MTGRPDPARAAPTDTDGLGSGGVVTRAALDMPRIRARLAELGLGTDGLEARLGVTLRHLSGDPYHRTVSLTMLVRLSRLLDLRLDDLVVTIDPHTRPPTPQALDTAGHDPASHDEPDLPGDDHLLLGLVSSYNGLSVGRVLYLLGWSHERLDAALAVLGEHLAPTALRVVATDNRLLLMLRPSIVPAYLLDRFEHHDTRAHTLDPTTAVEVVRLVREKILQPFPDHEEERGEGRTKSFDAVDLVGRRVAVAAANPTGDPDVEIHPGVLFALGLTDVPAPDGPSL
ncbi:hypothetical protein FHX81_4142 [Saccharothrix saharensis]|uniref:Uncharacterized protein n=1 Tax=Saccharothrix saharensis TaxID=571190 RepID=A0A543JFZ5_9PSEU|nr:hypothetical protein [Saccharothrix saharensis]TQM81765.1 hypothetical protein FHX81_4142 [Saccharothrix saharensis]